MSSLSIYLTIHLMSLPPFLPPSLPPSLRSIAPAARPTKPGPGEKRSSGASLPASSST